MAPEVMEQLHGYDFKADIWSFGITALELAHGHAPFSKYPPMKVFLMTLQNAPPSLDYERDKKFTRSFKQMIAMCLVKDPSKRPSAQKLLKQPFFKQARSQDYICRKILEGLPRLADRHQALKDKEEDLLAQKKIPDGKKEEMSQNEYKRGISSWNFDIEDLRSQASLITDSEENLSYKDGVASSNSYGDGLDMFQDGTSYSASCSSKDDDEIESDGMNTKSPRVLLSGPNKSYQRTISNVLDNESKSPGQSEHNNLQNGVQSKGSDRENCFGRSCESKIDEKDTSKIDEKKTGTTIDHSSNEKRFMKSCSTPELIDPPHEWRFSKSSSSCERKYFTSQSSLDNAPSSKGDSLKQQLQLQNMGNCNGDVSQTVNEMIPEAMPKASKSTATNSDDLDDKSKPPVVQQKGRFKVTSETIDLDKAHPSIGLTKSHSMQVFSQIPSPNMSDTTPNNASIFHQLHCILQNSILQRDYALSVMKQLSTGRQSGNQSTEGLSISPSSISLLEASTEREKELIQEVADLQWRIICKDEEIQWLKTRLAQV